MNKLLLGICFFVLSKSLFAQEFLDKNDYFFSHSNGMKQLVIEDAQAKEAVIGIVFNFGAFLEDENFDGLSFVYEKILAERWRQNLRNTVKEYASDSSLFFISSETSYQYLYLSVTSPHNHLSNVLQALYNSVIAPIDSAEVVRAVAISNTAYQRRSNNPRITLDAAIGAVLWESNFSKRNFIHEWNDSVVASLPARLDVMKKQYLCAGNCLLVIKGNVKAKETSLVTSRIFNRWARCTISLIGRFPGHDYKLIRVNSQLILEDSLIATPFYEIAMQGAPTFEGIRNNYCASIFSGILADPNSKIHRYLKDSCHLAQFQAENDVLRSFGQLTLTVTPDSGFLGEGIECFRSFITGANDSLIDDADLQASKANFISKFKNIQSNDREHVFLVARYWTSFSVNEYSTFEDSVNAITLKDMHHYLDKYLYKRYSVAALCISPAQRDSINIDSIFTPTSTNIRNYEFHFLKNAARFASVADDSVFTSLVQYLKLNPEVKIKVNGICHETELLEISDDALMEWVRSLDHFIMNPPSLVESKRFRLDVYRSLTLIKKLTESGIDMGRLYGTGNLVRSPEESDKYQKANCSPLAE